MDKKKIGLFLAQLRRDKKLTQDELANELHVDRSVVSKWERGKYLPHPEMLVSISHFFAVDINEILLGEKKTKQNENELHEVTINVLKDTNSKIKKITLLGVSIIMLIFLSFLSYYFINTYNSISVYKVTGDASLFYVNDGVMIVSKEKAYLIISSIRHIGNNHMTSATLYYEEDGKEKILGKTNNNKPLFIINDFHEQKSLFKEENLVAICKTLKLKITYNTNESEVITLHFEKDFANKSLIFNSLS